MSIFRSEEMVLCQLFLQREAAYACVSEFGERGILQFKDLNTTVSAFQRKFVNEVRRCEEMERKLRFMEKEIHKDRLISMNLHENPKAPSPKEMVDLEATFERIGHELCIVISNSEDLNRNFLELSELKEVLVKTQHFFQFGHHSFLLDAQNIIGVDNVGISPGNLGYVAGVISRERIPGFERLLWFACRGNVFMRHDPIEDPLEDPVSGDPLHKDVFIIFFQGEQLKNKVTKICDGFKAKLYTCPDLLHDREDMMNGVNTRLEDLKTVISQTVEHRKCILMTAQKEIHTWIIKVEKIKAIYYTLNMFNFEVAQNSLIAECWCPKRSLTDIQAALKIGERLSGSTVPSIIQVVETNKQHPTYFRSNKFTIGFQNIVDAYGIASYTEINPALFTIITFPFLFAVMFGDAGHGCIMFLFGLFMLLNEKKFLKQNYDNEIWSMFLGGRYIITLMGLFSMYTGIIYNDIFSKSANIFGSAWQAANYRHFKKYLNVFVQFIPELLFLGCLFGYLWVLIFYKWIVYDAHEATCAPALLIQFINMFMQSYTTPPAPGNSSSIPCSQWTFYGGQRSVQTFFVLLALLCVPVLLFVKPIVLRVQHKRRLWAARRLPTVKSTETLIASEHLYESESSAAISVKLEEDTCEIVLNGTDPSMLLLVEQESFDFGEVFIHQAIHTIEFCLGCISHTASYLRLWALSLAHAQLSEVLWGMVLHLGFIMDLPYVGSVLIFAVWFLWANLTVAVLLLMEGLSAFLHTLRLHWVEFQSKFYEGDGIQFVPFTFKEILCIDTLDDDDK